MEKETFRRTSLFILRRIEFFKLCNFRYPKGQKFHAYGQRGRFVWHGLLVHYFIWILNIRNEVAIKVSRPNNKESE